MFVVCVVCVVRVLPTFRRTSLFRTAHFQTAHVRTALFRTAQNFALFFFPLPPHFRSFCLSLGVFSLNFGGLCEDPDPQMCTFGELQTCTFQSLGAPPFGAPPFGPPPFGPPPLELPPPLTASPHAHPTPGQQRDHPRQLNTHTKKLNN